jgi:hypothetical protein
MLNIKHKITVEKGKVKFSNLDLFNEDLRNYEGQEAYLVISKYRKNRSNNQNRYYWGVVIKILSDEFGFEADEMHEVLKQKFQVKETLRIGKEDYVVVKPTHNQNTTEFEEYLSHIRTWASVEMGISIPLPHDVEY